MAPPWHRRGTAVAQPWHSRGTAVAQSWHRNGLSKTILLKAVRPKFNSLGKGAKGISHEGPSKGISCKRTSQGISLEGSGRISLQKGLLEWSPSKGPPREFPLWKGRS